MRPITFINGVILACSVALSTGLAIIIFMRWTMRLDSGLDQNLVQNSLPLAELCRNMLIFTALAILAGVAFHAEIKRRRWRWWVEYLLLTGFTASLILLLAVPDRRAAYLMMLGSLTILVAGTALGIGFVRSRKHARH